MESDDDFDSFSLHNNEPSPSPKHRRLKRVKNSTIVADQSTTVGSVSELIQSPRVDLARLETLESSDIRAFYDSDESEGFDDKTVNGDRKETNNFDGDDDGKVKELSSCYDDTRVNIDQKEYDSELELEEKSSSGFGDMHVITDRMETNRSLSFDDDVSHISSDCVETHGDLELEKKLSSASSDMHVRPDRKETKRALEFDDEIHENGVDQTVGKESETISMKIGETGEKDVNADVMNEKKGKKRRLKSSGEDSKSKISVSNKRREEKERKAYLEQLHAENQRLQRETRGVSFIPVPPVQKPISSILERIRQRKLEMSKKFSQHNSNDLIKEDDDCLKQVVIDHSMSIETEVDDLSESVKKEKVSNVLSEDLESDEVGMDVPDDCGEKKSPGNACSQMALDKNSTPVLRAPVDDTQELFGDSQTSDSKESENEEPEQSVSSHEEEMGPSKLTMELKFDSVPDDISDEEENAEPCVQKHSSPKGDRVKAFVDDEAEEEDDSDNDRMRFGDDEEDEDDDDDTEELNNMIAIGYKEKPVDLETRNELHQKWLEEKDATGTDDLLRRLNVASKLREASLIDDEKDEDDVELTDDVEEEDVERPRASRIDSKRAKEMIAQMFTDKDEDFLSSDDEETEKILVKERMLNKVEEKGKLVSPDEDEDSKEVFSLIKKLNTVPETRKKAKPTSFFDTMLTGGNSNSSSKSSFLSRASTHSVPTSSKQKGSSGVRSFIFGRDDSNSRSSISVSDDTSDITTTSKEIQTKKVTIKYNSSQSQARSSTQTTKLVAESSTSLFDVLKRSSVQSNVDKQEHKVELSQSVFAAFKIPKKPIKIQGKV